MASIGKIVRRTFLFGGVAIAGGVAFGVWQINKDAPNPLRPAEGETALNPFVLIDGAGVTLIAPRAEMGQGTRTTWAALLAEELDIAWEDIRVIHGPAAKAYYNHAMMGEGLPNKGYDASAFQQALGETMGSLGKLFDMQVTGGSTAMKDGYERMRVAGATAREMLKAAAANRLGVAPETLGTEDGHVIAADGTRIPYTDLAAEAAGIAPPNVILREPDQWRYLGRSLPRVDMVEKSTGTAQFAVDTRLPGMKFAALRMSPKRGGMRSFDGFDAGRMPGVERVIDMGDGVAVVASNTWLAQQAVDAIPIEWEDAPYPAQTDAMFAAIEAAFDTEPNSTMRDDGDVTDLPGGATELSASYKLPFLAHATMEPMNATAWITPEGLRVWAGNQAPTFVRDACAAEAGLSPDQVEVITPYMGGGFGRRGEMDFAVLATRVAKAIPGTPIQLTWSREEDMTHDFYRPAALARMRGAVADGQAVMLDAQVAAPSVARQALGRWIGFAPGGPDKVTVEGLFNQPYAIPNYRARGYLADLDVPIGFWRSVGNSINGFVHESFIDEMAHAAGADPLDFRFQLAKTEWRPAADCLDAVREMSGWTGSTPEGVGRGVAMCYSFGTPVAMVIEVRDEGGLIRMTDAWIACDVGVALDPSIIEAQMVGGMVYGLSAAISEEITFEDGMVQQLNFPDYEALRMPQMPAVVVRTLETNPHLGGVGEPGTPPAAPALANAIFDLTGQRLRELPLSKSVDFYA
ncbi:xanthine dehydrogenase family protein molybdopterin-binding subunit [Aestuariicoccus sp. MJ-SS9]|uniref:xanthine dehydrogenase family protein molybdopterin-binding subunit n=1 Tax=Aestuariicoccus sp. MJ-SS9 TaxID=3079855 RepID=UPI00290B457F|nr:molybdopterin cofactor-binding domain-containing protein [Aestuariicoccus sp. MJ-SS9]MDU8911100.1 molybdopterin cofactor-binding domain-containing protein [Aestuariicoccus sp. MJ-SS9]